MTQEKKSTGDDIVAIVERLYTGVATQFPMNQVPKHIAELATAMLHVGQQLDQMMMSLVDATEAHLNPAPQQTEADDIVKRSAHRAQP